jgi:orotidine-5'-phosphate decarboxylase
MNKTRQKISALEKELGGLLSVGVEPCPEYLPSGFEPTLQGYRDFFKVLVEATRDNAAVYKMNLAFFEALGPDGWKLLFDVRAMLPEDRVIIADAKRGDIGTSSKKYADALYKELAVDSVTVNPLMGHDSCEPFLEYSDKLTFFLVLTSNDGALDFLQEDEFFVRVACHLVKWDAGRGATGFVVGATRGGFQAISMLRNAGPDTLFLVPGIGAQGGYMSDVVVEGKIENAEPDSGLLFHVTRGILPNVEDDVDPAEIIARKTADYLNTIHSHAEL